MTAHTCRTLTRGCYRCELNVDEMRTIKRRDYTRTTRLWGRCDGCGCTWHWNGLTENARDGERMISRSGCMCLRSEPSTAPLTPEQPPADHGDGSGAGGREGL